MLGIFLIFSIISHVFALPMNEKLIENGNKEIERNSIKISLSRAKRQHGKVDESYLWPNATVPLLFDPAAITPEHELQIRDAIQIIENATCVRFVNYTNEIDFVNVTGNPGGSCKSKVGRRGGQQLLKLPSGACNGTGYVLHELTHLLSFHHIHISPNRDDYIKIVWENVYPPYIKRFIKRLDTWGLSDFGTGYDYDSIMHTVHVAYSRNGLPTILTKDPKNQHRIGQRNKLSDGDVLRINRMYKCQEKL